MIGEPFNITVALVKLVHLLALKLIGFLGQEDFGGGSFRRTESSGAEIVYGMLLNLSEERKVFILASITSKGTFLSFTCFSRPRSLIPPLFT